ncbi:MAG: kinase/pyrophosphorylase [Burkholderiales bacterium]|jgi:regulator of PEP synthase PpsR (kinase-PPPase family)|nr:kinase/pyrophosphorylase [Burkholderiales bacterium]
MTNLNKVTTRTVLIISDGTGITAETFCHAVLAQFDSLKFRQLRIPFVDTPEKAEEARIKIEMHRATDGFRPIVFSTLVNAEINAIVKRADAMFLDLFTTFVEPLETELGVQSTHSVGRFHHTADSAAYKNRIEAINYSLTHDDGQTTKDLEAADVILVGVSRSGKTPTSLYLAMQYGLKAANCPLIPEDFDRGVLPSWLPQHKHKIFGLTISPERLSEIRNERRPNSKYASIENCRHEVKAAEEMMIRENITWLSSTTKSIEEIATTVLQKLNLEKGHF